MTVHVRAAGALRTTRGTRGGSCLRARPTLQEGLTGQSLTRERHSILTSHDEMKEAIFCRVRLVGLEVP